MKNYIIILKGNSGISVTVTLQNESLKVVDALADMQASFLDKVFDEKFSYSVIEAKTCIAFTNNEVPQQSHQPEPAPEN